eukprot:m.180052 g.180052  ORF g.180052 m.180052 type:complete len:144 (+) comp39237_c0_seq29:837-1268(+)
MNVFNFNCYCNSLININVTVAHAYQWEERERALFCSQYSSSQSPEGSLDDDAMQEVSIDAAVRAQTWSRLSKGSAEERVDAVNSKKNFTDGSISNGSDESAAAAKPPRPRNPMDQREVHGKELILTSLMSQLLETSRKEREID